MLKTELQLLFEELVGLEIEVVGCGGPRKATMGRTWTVEEESERKDGVDQHASIITGDEGELRNRA